MSEELKRHVLNGKITWVQAAEQAQEARNVIMDLIRSKSSPIGLSIAQRLKSEGKTLNDLVARKTSQLYGRSKVFSRLTAEQQNKVYSEIVKSSGKSNPKVTSTMKRLSAAGRGLVLISVALSVYTIASSDNKLEAAGKEVVINGAGIGGGIAGGALAGLACGPGAPVCVSVGAFVGGALAAFGVGFIW
ncbi:hypothetical protein [Photobacterium sanguinicancri]|uniref:hypothetical protein n=1 Tax=Photobacterium sanguinicancri TaxID=875932 RepID=UPI003D0F6482